MWQNFALAFTAIFVGLDIIGTLPLYVSMTRGLTASQRAIVVNRSMSVALGVALVFIFLGQPLFRSLGIEFSDFRIAGGLVLLLIALADLVSGPNQGQQGVLSGSTGIIPLAVPLITGPGVLTQLLLQVGNFGYQITLLALFSNYALAWVLLRKSDRVTRLIGRDGTVVISKVAALLLAAIAVSMIRSGIFDSVRSFKQGFGL